MWQAVRNAQFAIPSDVFNRFAAAADHLTMQNLRVAAECGALRHRFDAVAIPILFVKGISLAQLAYGNILVKSGWDIDILVPPAAAPEAAVVLRNLGYEPRVPARLADAPAVATWHRLFKESVWYNSARGTHVELHTSLADHAMLLRDIGIFSPCREVQIGAHLSLPTLAAEELFAYLCVHGASSAWFRLKWIADVAALLAHCDRAEILRLYGRSQELGAARAADVALILCYDLFQTDLDHRFVEKLRAPAATRRLIDAVRQSLTGRAIATELSELPLGTLGIHRFQFGVMPGLRYKMLALKLELKKLARFRPLFRARR